MVGRAARLSVCFPHFLVVAARRRLKKSRLSGPDDIADVCFCGDTVAMNRLGLFAYGAGVAAIALFTARETIEPSVYLFQKHSSGAAALGATGWFIATFGPLALSIWFWRWACRLDARWVLHLLYVPFSIATFRVGESILYNAAGVPDGDSIEGWTLLAASSFLVLALLVHIAALAALGVTRVRRRANVR